jgi:hypothetical protein
MACVTARNQAKRTRCAVLDQSWWKRLVAVVEWEQAGDELKSSRCGTRFAS